MYASTRHLSTILRRTGSTGTGSGSSFGTLGSHLSDIGYPRGHVRSQLQFYHANSVEAQQAQAVQLKSRNKLSTQKEILSPSSAIAAATAPLRAAAATTTPRLPSSHRPDTHASKVLLGAIFSGLSLEVSDSHTHAHQHHHVKGVPPLAVETLSHQKKRALNQLRKKQTPLEKYLFMALLRNTNPRLFYKIVIDELEELAPIIYTPTVGTACVEYSNIYPFLGPPGVPDGLFITLNDLPHLHDIIRNYQPDPALAPQIAVITDGSRILGLGDLGVGGIGIPIGKLQLYVAGAGIDPRKTLPIVLDLGTNTDRYLQDEFYLGIKQKRPDDEVFFPFVDAVIKALHDVFPGLLVQFEDWSTDHAFQLLEKYQHSIFCFNDDIQGTGAVILSGFMNAVKYTQKKDGVDPHDHRIVFFGAGSAGVGVAKQLVDYFVIEHGIPEEKAKRMFWLVDSKGLVTVDRGDKLAQHKIYFARDDNEGKQIKSLLEVIEQVKPTALVGLSTVHGAFDEPIVRKMAALNKQPIIFPLSNPIDKSECTFEQAMIWTDHRAIFASGTAFPRFTVPETGEVKIPGQGNNMYIFPGLGQGAILSKPLHITDRMVYEAAAALAESLNEEELSRSLLYPFLPRIREVSAQVAAAVCVQAVKEGLARDPEVLSIVSPDDAEIMSRKGHNWNKLIDYVVSKMWRPEAESNEKSHL